MLTSTFAEGKWDRRQWPQLFVGGDQILLGPLARGRVIHDPDELYDRTGFGANGRDGLLTTVAGAVLPAIGELSPPRLPEQDRSPLKVFSFETLAQSSGLMIPLEKSS